MKRIILLILLMLILILPLVASSGKFDWNPIIGIAGLIIVPVVTKLTSKLFKKLNIDLDDSILEAAFAEAWKLIRIAEKQFPHTPSRAPYVKEHLDLILPAKTKEAAIRRYGSLDNFVQAAFESSNVSLKK